jgi:hypothetical protein
VGKREAAETQNDFAGLCDGMDGDATRRKGNDGVERGARSIEERLRFAMGDKPSIQIPCTAGSRS